MGRSSSRADRAKVLRLRWLSKTPISDVLSSAWFHSYALLVGTHTHSNEYTPMPRCLQSASVKLLLRGSKWNSRTFRAVFVFVFEDYTRDTIRPTMVYLDGRVVSVMRAYFFRKSNSKFKSRNDFKHLKKKGGGGYFQGFPELSNREILK